MCVGTFIRQRRALGARTSRYAWRKALAPGLYMWGTRFNNVNVRTGTALPRPACCRAGLCGLCVLVALAPRGYVLSSFDVLVSPEGLLDSHLDGKTLRGETNAPDPFRSACQPLCPRIAGMDSKNPGTDKGVQCRIQCP